MFNILNTHANLFACFLNPDPFAFAASSAMSSLSCLPSPANFPCAVTRAPALRFFSVCAPVRFEGPANVLAFRRRFMGFGREPACAPPHCGYKVMVNPLRSEASSRTYYIFGELEVRFNPVSSHSLRVNEPCPTRPVTCNSVGSLKQVSREILTVPIVALILQSPHFIAQNTPQSLEVRTMVLMLKAGQHNVSD